MFEGNTVRKLNTEDEFSAKSDALLVAQISDTNSSNRALNELLERHYTWIFRICLMRLGNTADAQDVTQDVFLRVQKYAHRFENRSAVRTWLYRIAQNQCNTFTAKFKNISFENIENYSEMLLDDDTERKRVIDELSEQVNFAMSKMPHHCKTMIELRFYQGLSLEEISKRLNIGLSATKMRLYRAIDRFKAVYINANQCIS